MKEFKLVPILFGLRQPHPPDAKVISAHFLLIVTNRFLYWELLGSQEWAFWTMLLHMTTVCASRRPAVGLAGYAPCLVPSHGHAALIPDASGRPCAPGLRAALARGNGVWWGGLAVPFNVPRCSRCQGLRARCALAS
jgi:hypothetical protein